MDIKMHETGTYVCIEGPRFSTKAESKMYRQWGADVVGMTLVPECVLAREAEICYASHINRHRLRRLERSCSLRRRYPCNNEN